MLNDFKDEDFDSKIKNEDISVSVKKPEVKRLVKLLSKN